MSNYFHNQNSDKIKGIMSNLDSKKLKSHIYYITLPN